MDKWQGHISISENDLKCYISPLNKESKLLKRISDYIIEFVCGYAQGFIQLLNVARLNDSSISLTRLDNLNFRESQT